MWMDRLELTVEVVAAEVAVLEYKSSWVYGSAWKSGQLTGN